MNYNEVIMLVGYKYKYEQTISMYEKKFFSWIDVIGPQGLEDYKEFDFLKPRYCNLTNEEKKY